MKVPPEQVQRVAERPPVPDRGDFSFIINALIREAYIDAWETIHTDKRYLNYLRTKPVSTPWAFIQNPLAREIINSLKLADTHSGCSVAITMRSMEQIIKYGWQEWHRSAVMGF